jgi:hypothetical protein
MARIAVDEIDNRLSIWGLSTYGDRTSRLSSLLEPRLLHLVGLSPRSRNIGGALPLCNRRFHLRMGAVTAVGTNRTNRTGLTMSVVRGRPECAGRPARSRWCKSITMKE